jgi:hypothetical protein
MSMMRSNTTSVTRMLITPKLPLSGLSPPQVFASCDHEERICGYQVSRAKSKQPESKYSPVRWLRYHVVSKKISYNSKEVLTVDSEYDICHPYAHCDHIDNLVPVPNGDSAKLP